MNKTRPKQLSFRVSEEEYQQLQEKFVSGLHCEPETVKEEMQATKELWGKTDGRTYKHYVQSYHEVGNNPGAGSHERCRAGRAYKGMERA